jgi:probable rRNA maturation factor
MLIFFHSNNVILMIQFSNQEIPFTLRNKLKIREWIRSIIKEENKVIGDISYIFCSDDYLYQMNKKYLNHQTLTDIITFEYNEGELVSGDIFISLDRVKENSKSFSKSFDEELGRVMAHGVLHLVGYMDKSGEDKSIMTEKENKYLNTFPNL